MADENEIVIRVRRDRAEEGGEAGGDGEAAPGARGRGGGFRGAFLGGAIGAIAAPIVAGILRPLTDLLGPIGGGLGATLLEPFLPVLEKLSQAIEVLNNFVGTFPARSQDFARGIGIIAQNVGDPSSPFLTGPATPGSSLDRARQAYATADIPGGRHPLNPFAWAVGIGLGVQEVGRTLTGRTEADQAHDPDAIYRNPTANRAQGGSQD